MRKLIECVPNISEGKNQSIIDEVVGAAKSAGVEILDVDAGKATHRTVITFVGGPDEVCEGAFQLIKKASELIDMRTHKGEHPRMGATDVCPFIPVQNVSMEECVAVSKKLAKRVGEELRIPVYLYEAAASSAERRSLAYLRQGEYEGLSQKLKNPAFKPDFGGTELNAKSGATVIGARPFLIAYNVNLNTKNKTLANQIAFRIRESGYKKKDDAGKFVRDEKGEPIIEPGLFKDCRAVGWYIEEFGIAQISINLTNYEVTSIHDVFDACSRLAEERGLRVTGSEIVGLVPKAALIASGKHYLRRQGATTAVPEREVIEMAIRSLSLSDLYKFNVEEKVIEEKVAEKKRLTGLTVEGFADLLSTDSPAPGGGSVAALAGSLAASLASMVGALSFGKAKDKEREKKAEFEALGTEAQALKAELLRLVEEDTAAFDKVMEAFRVKAATPEEENAKERKIVEAYKVATSVPLHVAKSCLRALELSRKTLETGLQSAFSDSAVGVQMAYAGFLGASYNVKINLKELKKKQAAAAELVGDFVDVTGKAIDLLSVKASQSLAAANQLIGEKL